MKETFDPTKKYTFTGEDPLVGMTGFDKEGDADKYVGQVCSIVEVCNDIDPDSITWICKFDDGTEAVILEENLQSIA